MKTLLKLLPFLSTILFIFLGFEYGLWHPAWLVYISIPLLGSLIHAKNLKDKVIHSSVFVALILFILVGYFESSYHPAWLFFMWIPVSRLIFDSLKDKILGIMLVLVSVYIYIYEPNNPVMYILLTVLLFAFGIISFDILIKLPQKIPFQKLFIWIVVAILYVYIGLEFNIWHPTWLVFFMIPLYEIFMRQYKTKRYRFIAYMPFISTILFFIIGEYFNRYIYAWLAFLLIPIVSILEQKK